MIRNSLNPTLHQNNLNTINLYQKQNILHQGFLHFFKISHYSSFRLTEEIVHFLTALTCQRGFDANFNQ